MKNILSKATFSLLLMLLFVGLALALTPQIAFAMPSAPGQKNITQPDGSQFGAQSWGDESASGFETLDGYSIKQQVDGWWSYMMIVGGNDKASVSSLEGLRVGVNNAPAFELHLERKLKTENIQSLVNPLETAGGSILQPGAEADILSSTTLTDTTSAPATTGTQPVLVILGYYEDKLPSTNPADFQGEIFGSGKSLRDYYAQASFGLLDLTPATENFGALNDGIVGWVNLGKTHPNPSNQDWNAVLTIIPLALNAADPYVDYSSFDKDGNKALSASELHIVLIIAGFEASYDGGAAQPCVWGHKWSLSTPVVADGMKLASYTMKGSYTMFGEIMGNHPSTMGIMAHEMGHDLGWPDLYGTGSAGLGTWDIMSFGGWNTAAGDTYFGQTPPLPNAYLQITSGWIDANDPAQLVPALNFQNTPMDLSNSTINPFAMILPVDSDPSSRIGEFYIIENRSQTGYDASLPGSGALVWHITESSSGNNDPLNLRVKLEQADGADHLLSSTNYGDAGDAFNASSLNKRFGVGTPLSSAYTNRDPSNILVVFGGGSASGFAPLIGPLSMGVTVSLVSSQTSNPADYHVIFLPLAQR